MKHFARLVLLLMMVAVASVAFAQNDADLHVYLQHQTSNLHMPKDDFALTKYKAVRVSLSPTVDAYVVYFSSAPFCGSGGCQLEVLTVKDGTFHKIAETELTFPPIRLLDSSSHGLRDLVVETRTYINSENNLEIGEKIFHFNGKKYIENPPLHRGASDKPGASVLTPDTPDQALFP